MNRLILYSLTPHQHMSNNKKFKVTLTGGGPARQEIIEALNPPQAKAFAEARFPGYTACSANQVH